MLVSNSASEYHVNTMFSSSMLVLAARVASAPGQTSKSSTDMSDAVAMSLITTLTGTTSLWHSPEAVART